MVDPVTTGAAVVKAVGKTAKTDGLIKRVLGPPADALGAALARMVEARTRNVGRIVENADRKLGDKRELPGSVPMRVVGRILEEGSYCEDAMVVEYLGGVLASSRSGVIRDDRGARWVSLVTAMSAYEIRLHYLLYQTARTQIIAHPNASAIWGDEPTYSALELVVQIDDLNEAMDYVSEERANADYLTAEALFALSREELLGTWELGNNPGTKLQVPPHITVGPQGALKYVISTVGLQLFMWAHGQGEHWARWTDPDLVIDAIDCPFPSGVFIYQP